MALKRPALEVGDLKMEPGNHGAGRDVRGGLGRGETWVLQAVNNLIPC